MLSNQQHKTRLLFWSSNPTIKTVLFDDKINESVDGIISRFKLGDQEHLHLSSTLSQILSGELHPTKLANILAQKIQMPEGIIESIVQQIQEKIFNPIKTDLEKAYQKISPQPVSTSPTQQATTPKIEALSMPVPTPTAPPDPQPVNPLTRNPLTNQPRQPSWPTNNPSAPAPENLPTDQLSDIGHQTSEIGHRTSDIQDIRFLAKKNPAILDQHITSNYLIESGSGQSIPPTVKNWLLDYVRIAGSGNHSSLDRGRYLIKGPNAKNLTEDERNLVNKIIESYDSGSPLTVDINTGLLLLPNKRGANFPVQGTHDVHTFQVMPVSFGNIVDLQDY